MYERGIRSLGFNGQNLFLYYLRHCALIGFFFLFFLKSFSSHIPLFPSGKSGDEVNKAIHSALSHMFSVNSVSSSPFSSSSSTLPTSSLPTSKGEWEEGLVQALGVVRVGWGKEVAKNFCSLVLSLPWSPSSLFHFSRVEMCVQQEGLELVGGEGEGGEGEVREAFEEGVRGGGGEEGIFWFAYYDWERRFFISFLFYFILFYFILFYFILFYFILFYFILFYFILFYFILFYFILFYFILFYFILFCFISDPHNQHQLPFIISSRGNHENAGKIHRRALKSLSDPSEFVEMHAQSTLMD